MNWNKNLQISTYDVFLEKKERINLFNFILFEILIFIINKNCVYYIL